MESLSFLEWKIKGDQIIQRTSYYENEAEKIITLSKVLFKYMFTICGPWPKNGHNYFGDFSCGINCPVAEKLDCAFLP